MTLTEARSLSRLAGAERSAGGITVLIHLSHQGYHLTRYAPDNAGRFQVGRRYLDRLQAALISTPHLAALLFAQSGSQTWAVRS